MVALAEQPSTGYELNRRFSQSIGHFWSTTHQQIYRTLKKLHDQGYLSSQDVAQTGKPDKKVYSLTPAGHDELSAWIATPTGMPQLRSDFGVKLRGAEHAAAGDVIANVAEHQRLHQAQLDLYQRYMDAQFPDVSHLAGRQLHQYLVLRGGIITERAQVEWCQEILEAITTAQTPAQDEEQPQ